MTSTTIAAAAMVETPLVRRGAADRRACGDRQLFLGLQRIETRNGVTAGSRTGVGTAEGVGSGGAGTAGCRHDWSRNGSGRCAQAATAATQRDLRAQSDESAEVQQRSARCRCLIANEKRVSDSATLVTAFGDHPVGSARARWPTERMARIELQRAIQPALQSGGQLGPLSRRRSRSTRCPRSRRILVVSAGVGQLGATTV